MKQIYFYTILVFTLFFVTSCRNDKETIANTNTIDSTATIDSIIDTHNAENSLDYHGTYEGTLPCFTSECKEIEISVKLLPDNVFVYSTKRLEVDKEELMTTGTYHFEPDGNTIVLDQIANVPNSFFVSEGKIYQLNKDQQRITGEHAEKYVLIKK